MRTCRFPAQSFVSSLSISLTLSFQSAIYQSHNSIDYSKIACTMDIILIVVTHSIVIYSSRAEYIQHKNNIAYTSPYPYFLFFLGFGLPPFP